MLDAALRRVRISSGETVRNSRVGVLAFTKLLADSAEASGFFCYRHPLQKFLHSDSPLEKEHFFPFHLSSLGQNGKRDLYNSQACSPIGLLIKPNAQQVSLSVYHLLTQAVSSTYLSVLNIC